jgi:hypothetical protein
VPANYVNQVTGRRLDTDPLLKTAGRGPRPAAPRVSQEIRAGALKYEEVKKRRNDVNAIVDAVMGKKPLVADFAKKDPIGDLQIVHRHAVDDQAVVMPGGARAAAPAGLEGVTAADLEEARARGQVPNPSEVLRRYKMFTTDPEVRSAGASAGTQAPSRCAAGRGRAGAASHSQALLLLLQLVGPL